MAYPRRQENPGGSFRSPATGNYTMDLCRSGRGRSSANTVAVEMEMKKKWEKVRVMKRGCASVISENKSQSLC